MDRPRLLAMILACSSLSLTVPAGAAYVGQWSFDSDFTDSSGLGNHLSAVSGAPGIVFGVDGNAASFDGSQFLYSSSGILTATRGVYSMGAWVKTSNINGPDAIILGNFFDDGTQVYRAGLTDHYGTVYGYVQTGGNSVNSSAVPKINDGQWHHLAVTFGPEGAPRKNIKLYVDGALVDQRESSYGATISVTEFSVGGRSILNNTYTGLIDEAFFSADELTASEIAALATRPPDNDGDGVPYWDDNCEEQYNPGQEDFDGDDIGDACDPDGDNDGLPNIYETGWSFTDPLDPDTDDDGLTDTYEIFSSFTDPLQRDSDGDGFGDAVEIDAFTDPNDPAGPWPPADGDLALLYLYDGVVNIGDYLVAARMVLGLVTPTDLQKAHGDLDYSGEIDLPDLLLILKMVTGP